MLRCNEEKNMSGCKGLKHKKKEKAESKLLPYDRVFRQNGKRRSQLTEIN